MLVRKPLDPYKIAAYAGLVGCTIIIMCTFITAWMFEEAGESYSLWNHFISELGHTQRSVYFWVFNSGLIFGGAFMIIFALGIRLGFTGKFRDFLSVLAFIAAISCSLVGVFPVDDFENHVTVALSFFGMGLITIVVVTTLTLMGKTPDLPKASVIPGIITALAFAGFLLSPSDLFRSWVEDPDNFVRPAIWHKPIIEWVCFFSMLGWIIMVSWIQLVNPTRGAKT
ncbi:MAG: DUF998 domain-containing protein [Flavobacteriales bacterium]|nr:DUF998 domain-containing protein [Flavobacteriales bacterium]